MTNDTSSTAAVSPNIFVTWSRRRWMSVELAMAPGCVGAGSLLMSDARELRTGGPQRDATAGQEREHAEHDDGHADVGDRERGRAAEVQIVHQLEDPDRGDRAA